MRLSRKFGKKEWVLDRSDGEGKAKVDFDFGNTEFELTVVYTGKDD